MGKGIKIYTKTGDDGTTGLVGGSRVKKYDVRLEAYGTVDELNAVIGILRSFDLPDDISELLIHIQNKLFSIGSRLASDEKDDAYTARLLLKQEDILVLENAIDEFEKVLPELKHFILPGGDLSVAHCHVARTICRRAERRIIEFSDQFSVQPEIIKYINRLSDFMFILARYLSVKGGVEELLWEQ